MKATNLDESGVGLVRDLWPDAKWTEAIRQEWRARLAPYPSNRVTRALRDSYAEASSRYPRLDDVMSRIRANASVPRNDWKDGQPDMRDIERDHKLARQKIKDAPPEKMHRLVNLYRERVGTMLPENVDEWKRNQVMIAVALYEIL